MPVAVRRQAPGKRSDDVSVRADLADEAVAFGTSISALPEAALEERHRAVANLSGQARAAKNAVEPVRFGT